MEESNKLRDKKRQRVLDFLYVHDGKLNTGDWEKMGLSYQQELGNHLRALRSEGYIELVGNKRYIVLMLHYQSTNVVSKLRDEIARLTVIEKKYNKIVNIINNGHGITSVSEGSSK